MKTPSQLVIDGFDESNITYGDTITHSTIRGWAGLEIPDTHSMAPSDVKKAMDEHNFKVMIVTENLKKHTLLNRKMLLKNIRGSGYHVLMPGDQVDSVVTDNMRDIKRSLKSIEVGIENVRVNMLNSSQRAHRSSVQARLSGLTLMMGSGRKLLKTTIDTDS